MKITVFLDINYSQRCSGKTWYVLPKLSLCKPENDWVEPEYLPVISHSQRWWSSFTKPSQSGKSQHAALLLLPVCMWLNQITALATWQTFPMLYVLHSFVVWPLHILKNLNLTWFLNWMAALCLNYLDFLSISQMHLLSFHFWSWLYLTGASLACPQPIFKNDFSMSHIPCALVPQKC